MLGKGNRVTGIRPLPNQSSEAERSYEIAPSDLESLLREEAIGGPSVIGFYHSHPDADPRPSVLDRGRAWPKYWYVIVGVEQGAATSHCTWRSTHA
jgi:proteasome lid subunit RPN8/RPN11